MAREQFGVYVYQHPDLLGTQRYRLGPYEDAETASAVGHLLFGRWFSGPGQTHLVGWYTADWNTLNLSPELRLGITFIDYPTGEQSCPNPAQPA